MAHVLDQPVWHALGAGQRHFGERSGAACRYAPDVAPFGALDPDALATGGAALFDAWRDLAALLGAGGSVGLVFRGDDAVSSGDDAGPAWVPPGWAVDFALPGVQMVGDGVAGRVDPEARDLSVADVAAMTALVDRTRPGPFARRTVELGGYVGHFEAGRLVAMAGERMRPPGFAEVSAVATDAAWRGRGLATTLVRHVVAGIAARGEVPFLHAAADNTSAIALYERLGFARRRGVTFVRVRAPG